MSASNPLALALADALIAEVDACLNDPPSVLPAGLCEAVDALEATLIAHGLRPETDCAEVARMAWEIAVKAAQE